MELRKKWIIAGVVIVILFAFGKYNESQAENKVKPIEPAVIEKPLTYEEQFDKKHFNELSGVYKPIRNFLKKNLNDPSSLEIENTWNIGMNKDSSFAIKTTFRAKNEFNALVLQALYCNVDMDGNVTDTRIE